MFNKLSIVKLFSSPKSGRQCEAMSAGPSSSSPTSSSSCSAPSLSTVLSEIDSRRKELERPGELRGERTNDDMACVDEIDIGLEIELYSIKADMEDVEKMQHLSEFIEANREKAFVCITSCVARSYALRKHLPKSFLHYKEDRADDFDRAHHCIIQCEFLHRVIYGYDYVIFDEVCCLASAVVSRRGINGPYLFQNADRLRIFVQGADGVICLESTDLKTDDNIAPAFLKALAIPERVILVCYKDKKLKRSVVMIDDDERFEAAIIACLKQGERVAICCKTERRAKILEEICARYASKKKTLLLTAESLPGRKVISVKSFFFIFRQYISFFMSISYAPQPAFQSARFSFSLLFPMKWTRSRDWKPFFARSMRKEKLNYGSFARFLSVST